MKHTRPLHTSLLHRAWRKRIFLRTVVTSLAFAFLWAAPARAFDTFEHLYIGAAAYRKAMQSLQQAHGNDHKWKRLFDDADTFFDKVDVPPAPHFSIPKVLCHVPLLSRYPLYKYCPVSPNDLLFDLVHDAILEIPFSFGDLSALAGDYAKTVGDLQDAVQPYAVHGTPGNFQRILAVRQHLIGTCHWLHQQAGPRSASSEPLEPFDPGKCFERMVNDRDKDRYFSAGGYRATREENAALEQTPHYVALAAGDQSHFPTHSWTVYREHHKRALEYAKAYAAGNDSS